MTCFLLKSLYTSNIIFYVITLKICSDFWSSVNGNEIFLMKVALLLLNWSTIENLQQFFLSALLDQNSSLKKYFGRESNFEFVMSIENAILSWI
jgi:hypothetical protein